MRTQLRIVAGALRGRKVHVTVHPRLRPTPDMVRQALFSILGDAVPGRPFLDVFAGTGVVGLEALSRGAAHVTFVERDVRAAADIDAHLRQFGVAGQASVVRADVYRWAGRWAAPAEPVNVFFSPPFADYEHRPEEFLALVRTVREKAAPASVVVVQSELDALTGYEAAFVGWDVRTYGRNELRFWVREESTPPLAPQGARGDEEGSADDGA